VACGSREFFELFLTVHPHDQSIMTIGIFRQINERTSVGDGKFSRSAVRRGFHAVENWHRLAGDLQPLWVERLACLDERALGADINQPRFILCGSAGAQDLMSRKSHC
jgi:hypothetical protein